MSAWYSAKMRRLLLVVIGLGFACAGPVEGLDPRAAQDGPGPDTGATLTCAAFDADLPTRNHTELVRLGFKLSATVLEGVLRPPVGDSTQVELTVSRVGRGHASLVGARIHIAPDQHFLSTTSLPGQVIVGFADTMVPLQQDGVLTLDPPLITLPDSERGLVVDLLDYPQQGSPFVAEVSVISKNDEQVVLRTHNVLAGEVPAQLILPNHYNFFDAYPAPATEPFIASFSHIRHYEGVDALVGLVADWRPRASRSTVAAALASPTPRFDTPSLRAFAESYLLGWTFNRAPRVVAGEMLGLADECCSSAGGTYVQYGLTHDFKDSPTESRFQVGGHAYYPSEVCGDQRIFAAGPLINSEPDEKFECAHSTFVDTLVQSTEIYAMLQDSPQARTQVASWAAAQGPLLRAHPSEPLVSPEAVAKLTDNAPWSRPLSVQQAVARAELAWVKVLAVESLADGHHVTLETTFFPRRLARLERFQIQLAFECGDPRLLVPGNTLLLPFVSDAIFFEYPTALANGAIFFVPGIAFEPAGPAATIAYLFARELRR